MGSQWNQGKTRTYALLADGCRPGHKTRGVLDFERDPQDGRREPVWEFRALTCYFDDSIDTSLADLGTATPIR